MNELIPSCSEQLQLHFVAWELS